jgi:hypothetical protein
MGVTGKLFGRVIKERLEKELQGRVCETRLEICNPYQNTHKRSLQILNYL